MHPAARALLSLLLLAAGGALAVPTQVTAKAPAQVPWGHPGVVEANVSYEGPVCPTSTLVSIPGTLTLEHDRIAEGHIDLSTSALKLLCLAGQSTYSGNYFFTGVDLPFGSYQYTLEYSGGPGFDPSASAPVAFSVVPEYVLQASGGTVKVGLSGHNDWGCSGSNVAVAPPPAASPAGVTFPYGGIQADLGPCAFNCGFLCPPGIPDVPWHDVLLELPAPIQGPASVWIYGPGGGQDTPVWRRVSATVDGARVSFQLSGNKGQALKGYMAVASGAPSTAMQDLWWGGPAQNGWGLSIAQSGEQLFGGLYVYRDDGQPVWAFMPGGTWNADHSAFSGPLYAPSGSWLGDYKPSALQVGPALGTGRLTFGGASAGTFDYTIGSSTGRQALQRFVVGPGEPVTTYSGMWWGGVAENGWGLYLSQSGSTVFAVWYTYDTHGLPVWYVMSDGKFASDANGTSAYGTLYRTVSAPWLGGAYDPARFQPSAAGTLGIQFWGPEIARMTYEVDGVRQVKPIYRFPF